AAPEPFSCLLQLDHQVSGFRDAAIDHGSIPKNQPPSVTSVLYDGPPTAESGCPPGQSTYMSIYGAQSRARLIRLLGVMFGFTREEFSMRSATFVKIASLLWLAFATPVPAADDKEDDKKSIQGTWVVDPEVYKNVKDKEVVKEMKAV